MRTALVGGWVAAALLCASVALGAGAGDDEVTLKGGATIRGTVVAYEPGTQVKILEAGSSAPRVVPWAEVSDVERGKYAARPAEAQPGAAGPGYAGPTPPAAAPEPPPPALGEPGVVRLHVDSPARVTVFEHTPPMMASANGYTVVFDQMRPVCSAPCDRVIDGRQGQTFTATGDFMGATGFTLDDKRGDVDLKVRPGSKALFATGLTLTGVGGAAAIGGLFVYLAGASAAESASLFHESPEKGAGARTAGIAMAIGGGVAVVGGIVMAVAGRTKFELKPHQGDQKPSVARRALAGTF